MEPLISATVGGCLIQKKLGQGGMGEVYQAVQLSLERPVALKILDQTLTQNETYLARFEREAQVVAQINHPNIISVYNMGQDTERNITYFIMELVRGQDLSEILKTHGPLSEPQAVEVALNVARALKAALDKHIIHRDIKPANIMITQKGEVKVADFGLAKYTAEATLLTQTGQLLGTPAFLSPEQGQGAEVDHRSDIYSLGASLFYIVTGEFPYKGSNMFAVVGQHIRAPIPDPRIHAPELSAAFCQILRTMMAKRPEDRYQDYNTLIAVLEQLAQAQPQEANLTSLLSLPKAAQREKVKPESSPYTKISTTQPTELVGPCKRVSGSGEAMAQETMAPSPAPLSGEPGCEDQSRSVSSGTSAVTQGNADEQPPLTARLTERHEQRRLASGKSPSPTPAEVQDQGGPQSVPLEAKTQAAEILLQDKTEIVAQGPLQASVTPLQARLTETHEQPQLASRQSPTTASVVSQSTGEAPQASLENKNEMQVPPLEARVTDAHDQPLIPASQSGITAQRALAEQGEGPRAGLEDQAEAAAPALEDQGEGLRADLEDQAEAAAVALEVQGEVERAALEAQAEAAELALEARPTETHDQPQLPLSKLRLAAQPVLEEQDQVQLPRLEARPTEEYDEPLAAEAATEAPSPKHKAPAPASDASLAGPTVHLRPTVAKASQGMARESRTLRYRQQVAPTAKVRALQSIQLARRVPPAPARRSRHWLWLFPLIIGLLSWVGVWYYRYDQKRRQEILLWVAISKKAAEQNNPALRCAAYQRYLQQYPQGRYVRKAQQQLQLARQLLAQEHKDYTALQARLKVLEHNLPAQRRAIGWLEKHLQKYPYSPARQTLQARLQALREEVCFQQLKARQARLEASEYKDLPAVVQLLQQYLARYPQGRYNSAVRSQWRALQKDHVAPVAQAILALKRAQMSQHPYLRGISTSGLDLMELVLLAWRQGRLSAARRHLTMVYQALDPQMPKTATHLDALLKYLYLQEIQACRQQSNRGWDRIRQLSQEALRRFPASPCLRFWYRRACQENIPARQRREYNLAVKAQQAQQWQEALQRYQQLQPKVNKYYQQLIAQRRQECEQAWFQQLIREARQAAANQKWEQCCQHLAQATQLGKLPAALVNLQKQAQKQLYHTYQAQLTKHIQAQEWNAAQKIFQCLGPCPALPSRWRAIFEELQQQFYLKQARQAFYQKRYQQALTICQKGLAACPASVALRSYLVESSYYLADEAALRKEYRRCVHWCLQGLAHKAQDNSLRHLLSKTLAHLSQQTFQRGQYQECIDWCDKALRHQLPGPFAARRKSAHKCLECYRQAKQAYLQKKYVQCIQWCQRGLVENPKDLLLQKLIAYTQTGQPFDIEQYEQQRRRYFSLYHQARQAFAQEQWQKAGKLFQQARQYQLEEDQELDYWIKLSRQRYEQKRQQFFKYYRAAEKAAQHQHWEDALRLYQHARDIGWEHAPTDLEQRIRQLRKHARQQASKSVQCYQAARQAAAQQRWQEALRLYQQARQVCRQSQRAEIDRQIEQIKRRITPQHQRTLILRIRARGRHGRDLTNKARCTIGTTLVHSGMSIKPGRYKLEVVCAGYRPLNRLITIAPGDTPYRLDLTLTPFEKGPAGWPFTLWRLCWDDQQQLVDFSQRRWRSLGYPSKIKYARAYQQWYARKFNLPVEKNINTCGVSFSMRLIPPGKFWMGSRGEKRRRPDEYMHLVVISAPFYIGKTEVTQLQWQLVMDHNPSYAHKANYPVNMVSWEDCHTFCAKSGLQMPSEAQWEYACRAGTTTPYNLGFSIRLKNVNFNHWGKNRGHVVTVGSLPNANSWGCYDFHGNVWEWCQDWYGPYPTQEVHDPTGCGNGDARVNRGGSWMSHPDSCRSARRRKRSPLHRSRYLGLRVMVPLKKWNHKDKEKP